MDERAGRTTVVRGTRLIPAALGGLLLTALLLGCGGDDEKDAHISALRSAVASVPVGEPNGTWVEVTTADSCTAESSGTETPPFYRATTRVPGATSDHETKAVSTKTTAYLDRVEEALPRDARAIERPAGYELRWSVRSEAGDRISIQLIVSNGSGQLTSIGPATWCD